MFHVEPNILFHGNTAESNTANHNTTKTLIHYHVDATNSDAVQTSYVWHIYPLMTDSQVTQFLLQLRHCTSGLPETTVYM